MFSLSGGAEEDGLVEQSVEERGQSVGVEEVEFVGVVGLEVVAAYLVAAIREFSGIPGAVVVARLVDGADGLVGVADRKA